MGASVIPGRESGSEMADYGGNDISRNHAPDRNTSCKGSTYRGAALSPLEGFRYMREAPAIHVDAFPFSPREAPPRGLYPAVPAVRKILHLLPLAAGWFCRRAALARARKR